MVLPNNKRRTPVSRVAIIVTIKLKPGSAEAFKPHILANAEAAIRDEAD